MPALIKELLLDYGLNRLNVDLRSDLTIAIQTALTSSVFNNTDARVLNLYLSGYTAGEIALKYMMLTALVELRLERIFTAIEQYSGYTDSNFIKRLELTNKYRQGGIRDLSNFLVEHSKHYTRHEIE